MKKRFSNFYCRIISEKFVAADLSRQPIQPVFLPLLKRFFVSNMFLFFFGTGVKKISAEKQESALKYSSLTSFCCMMPFLFSLAAAQNLSNNNTNNNRAPLRKTSVSFSVDAIKATELRFWITRKFFEWLFF